MARMVEEQLVITVTRIVRSDARDPDRILTKDHKLMLDGALAEIWELPAGAVVEVNERGTFPVDDDEEEEKVKSE